MDKKSIDKKIYELHAELCKTLAHPKRIEIINLLRDGEKPVKELLDKIGIDKGNLSQHLSILRKNNIVSTRRDGLNIYYQITKSKMIKACDIIRDVLFEQIEESKAILKYRR